MRYLFVFLLNSGVLFSQNDSRQDIFDLSPETNLLITENDEISKEANNLIKLGFPLLNQPALSIQYERYVFKKIYLGVSANYVSEQEFFLLKMIAKHKIKNSFARQQLRNVKTEIFSFSPEVKFYFGRDTFKGFYVAPFVRFSNYRVNFPLEYIEDVISNNYQQVNFSGNFNTFTFGVSMGAQWNIYKNFYLDWLIVGPHFGNSTERLNLNSNLSPMQQKGIIKSIDIVKKAMEVDGVPNINFDYEVNDQGGEIRFKNPWAGARLQIGVGYRF